MLNHRQEAFTQSRFGICRKLSGFIKQSNPGAGITTAFDENVTDSLNHPATVLFPDNQLINTAESVQDIVQVSKTLLYSQFFSGHLYPLRNLYYSKFSLHEVAIYHCHLLFDFTIILP
ncbi:MAG: hypothetical protein J7L90_04205 [Dehalococcoidia bacterium]|nr:hypothetical protein [Dehalococcoidia bacterium]